MSFGKRRSSSVLMILASSWNGLHRGVVRRGEAAADVEQVHLRVAAVPRLLEDVRGEVQRLHVVLEVGRLAADVEADALDHQPGAVGLEDEVDRLARGGAELGGELHHRAGVGHLQAQRQAGVRARAS